VIDVHDRLSLGSNRSESGVAIILVNWNGWRDCVECLDSLLALVRDEHHIFLVDNDSADQSVERIAAWCERPVRHADSRDFEGVGHVSDGGTPIRYRLVEGVEAALGKPPAACRLTIIRAGANLGFAGGNNVGLRAAGTADFDYFWLLNTDTVVRRDSLARLVERAERDAGIGIVGSTLLYYAEPSRIQAMGGASLDESNFVVNHIGIERSVGEVPIDPAEVEANLAYVVGASMLVSRAFVEQVGYMQEDYFLYFEEIDWALRGRGKFRMGYAPGSLVYHKVGASSAKTASWFSLRLLYRNRLKVVARFMPDRLPAAVRHMLIEMCSLLLKGRFRYARAIGLALRDRRQLIAEGRAKAVCA
jgi:GT2 family glycosyltransferase